MTFEIPISYTGSAGTFRATGGTITLGYDVKNTSNSQTLSSGNTISVTIPAAPDDEAPVVLVPGNLVFGGESNGRMLDAVATGAISNSIISASDNIGVTAGPTCTSPEFSGTSNPLGASGGSSPTYPIGTTTVTIGVGTVTPVGAGTTLTTGTGVGTTIGTTGAGTTFGNTGSASGTGNNNAVAVISSVSIISTGIGYTSGATATVTNGGGGSSTNAAIGSGANGAALNIVTNPLGQIVDVKLLSSGYGFTKIPRIKINSKTGAGADFRANLKFIPVSQFLEDQSLQTIDPNKLVQVVDCPDKPLTVKIL